MSIRSITGPARAARLAPTLLAAAMLAAADAPAPAAPPSTPALRLIDISLDVLTVAGGSTATDAEIGELQVGGHDPRRRGFTLQQAELSIAGAVDPYFSAEAHLIVGEDGVELEEAFATTSSLPYALQVKAGYFLAEIGRTNPTHPHAWAWLDLPIANGRILGPDGMRGAGARVAWLAPAPWFSELQLGLMRPDDETMGSFRGKGHPHGDHEEEGGETTVGGYPAVERETRSPGDMLWTARWANAVEVAGADVLLGASGAFGPNRGGGDADTTVLGADLTVKWRAPGASWRRVTWQSEVLWRRFGRGDVVDDAGTPALPGDDIAVGGGRLIDWGVVSQLLVGVAPRWGVGLRGERASGSGDSYELGAGPAPREDDPERSDRWRISPLVMFTPSEFSRLRLQYDYDQADWLPDRRAHSVWLGLEVLIGAHPAHGF